MITVPVDLGDRSYEVLVGAGARVGSGCVGLAFFFLGARDQFFDIFMQLLTGNLVQLQ